MTEETTTYGEKRKLLRFLNANAQLDPTKPPPNSRLREVLDRLEEIRARPTYEGEDFDDLIAALEEAHDLLLYVRGGGDPRAIDDAIG